MKKYIKHCLLILFILSTKNFVYGMFRLTQRRVSIPTVRQYSSPIKPDIRLSKTTLPQTLPEESSLRTRASLWWENFKDFMTDWWQSSKMRDAKRAAESAEQKARMERAARYVQIQSTMSQKELAEVERKQKEMTEAIEKGHQERITKMRKEAEEARKREWLERIRKAEEELARSLKE